MKDRCLQGSVIGDAKVSEAGALVGFVFKGRGGCNVRSIRKMSPCRAWEDRKPEQERRRGRLVLASQKQRITLSFLHLQCAGQERERTGKDKRACPFLFSQDNPDLIMYVQNESKFIKSAQTLDCSIQSFSHSKTGASVSFLNVYILSWNHKILELKGALKGIKHQLLCFPATNHRFLIAFQKNLRIVYVNIKLLVTFGKWTQMISSRSGCPRQTARLWSDSKHYYSLVSIANSTEAH